MLSLYPHCLLNHPILFLKVCHCCKCGSAAILSDVSYQDGLNRCLKNFPQPIYSPRHLLIGAAVPVPSKTLRTWTEQLEFSLTTLANSGHGGHGIVELCWSNGPDKLCVINPFNSALFLNSTPSLFQTSNFNLELWWLTSLYLFVLYASLNLEGAHTGKRHDSGSNVTSYGRFLDAILCRFKKKRKVTC